MASMMRQKVDGEAIFDGVHHQCSITVCAKSVRSVFCTVCFESQGRVHCKLFFISSRSNSAVRRQDRANCDKMTCF